MKGPLVLERFSFIVQNMNIASANHYLHISLSLFIIYVGITFLSSKVFRRVHETAQLMRVFKKIYGWGQWP